MLDLVIALQVYADSRSLYERVVCVNNTTKKRLLIDECIIRQLYERHDITEVFWIRTAQNPAEFFTKPTPTPALEYLTANNHLSHTPKSWLKRSTPSWGKIFAQVVATFCLIFEDPGVSDYSSDLIARRPIRIDFDALPVIANAASAPCTSANISGSTEMFLCLPRITLFSRIKLALSYPSPPYHVTNYQKATAECIRLQTVFK